MSRSYKKHEYTSDGRPHTTKMIKNRANRKTRSTDDIPNGAAYRRLYESWDIRECRLPWSWKEAKEQWEKSQDDTNFLRRFPTLKRFHRYWLHHAKNK